MQFNPSIGTTFNIENLQSPISPETSVVSWLTAIESYSKNSSYESRDALYKLAQKRPDCESLPEELCEAVNKIIQLIESKNWDPTLSPNTSKLLMNICRTYTQSKAAKPDCARQLF